MDKRFIRIGSVGIAIEHITDIYVYHDEHEKPCRVVVTMSNTVDPDNAIRLNKQQSAAFLAWFNANSEVLQDN